MTESKPSTAAILKKRLVARLPRYAASLVFIYVSVCAAMYFLQDYLIFPGSDHVPDLRAQAARLERMTFEPAPGVRLQGVMLGKRPEVPARRPLVIYFGGNAEEVTWWAQAEEWPENWAILLVNYRGFGTSTGHATEDALHADARFIYDRMAERADIDPARVVLFGRSLGSGVATRLATERKVAGLILATPYDSVASVARTHYPWLPVEWLVRHRFDSLALAPRITLPMLMLVTPEDRVIPVKHSERLYAAWGGPKAIEHIRGTDHTAIADAPEYWRAVLGFLGRM